MTALEDEGRESSSTISGLGAEDIALESRPARGETHGESTCMVASPGVRLDFRDSTMVSHGELGISGLRNARGVVAWGVA